MEAATKEKIIKYYDLSEKDYRLIWHLDQCMAMHYGFWDRNVRSLREALIRQNAVLAERAKISKSDRVLDAGCGVGGSSIYLAKNIGCRVTGITLSNKQVSLAKENAKINKVDGLVTFQEMDYMETKFPNESFDIVWGIESICYAPDKLKFIEESFRILKPGGRIIVGDGFIVNEDMVGRDKIEIRKVLDGWFVDSVDSIDTFSRYLRKAGFMNISYEDITKNVMPSSKRLYICSYPAFIWGKIAKLFRQRTDVENAHIITAFYQYKTLKRGLWQYGIFYAEKPKC